MKQSEAQTHHALVTFRAVLPRNNFVGSSDVGHGRPVLKWNSVSHQSLSICIWFLSRLVQVWLKGESLAFRLLYSP